MNDIKQHFEKEAHAFDDIMLKLSPYYTQMIDAVITMALAAAPEHPLIMDLGSGTGNVSREILKRCPDAKLTCLDISENMLNISKERLRTYSSVQYVNSSVEDAKFTDEFDVIISSLALHHVKTDKEKQFVYQKIYTALKPQGVFFNADIITSANELWQKIYRQKWIEYMQKSVSLDEINQKWIPRHEQFDSPKVLNDELRMLKNAGFQSTEVAWKYFNSAVYGAQK